MTDPTTPQLPQDQADLLASLYLDGEATLEEVALVEASPALLARVAEFRVVAAQVAAPVAPPIGLAHRQIQAALETYDEVGPAGANSPGEANSNVVSLSSRAEQPNKSAQTGRWQRGLPTWLGAAAAVLVVVGGIGVAASQFSSSGSDDSADFATAETRAGEEGADAAMQTESATLEEDAAAAESSMEDDAMEEEVMEEAVEEEESALIARDATNPATPDTTLDAETTAPAAGPDDTSATTTTPATGRPDLGASLGRSAVEIYVEAFDAFLLEDLLVPIAQSPCAASVVLPAAATIDGFFPVLLDGEPVDLVLLSQVINSDGQTSIGALLLDANCTQIPD